jgi:hypothetical protein
MWKNLNLFIVAKYDKNQWRKDREAIFLRESQLILNIRKAFPNRTV